MQALGAMPDETVIDGEIVALDQKGRPSFNALQNGSDRGGIFYYAFDVMILAGKDVTTTWSPTTHSQSRTPTLATAGGHRRSWRPDPGRPRARVEYSGS